ncbi:coiled-coil domain-containing protein 174-like [Watersipora subatra]|uniref:coiled-coil domain-containing protein 174-like n=1 Tax=Watersipora subatra TaxID=2589382 RepID=UPI00355B368B
METSGSTDEQTEIASASIVDLKAELFRKQQEYVLQKSLTSAEQRYVKGNKISGTRKKKTVWSGKNSGVQARSTADERDRRSYTDDEKLEASRLALEAKSKLYEQMAKTGDNAEDEDGCSLYLVDFEKKYIDKAMELRQRSQATASTNKQDNGDDSDKEVKDDLSDTDVPDEEQWVDFVDSFGRSRRCMKKDLEKMQLVDGGSKKTADHPDLMSADMHREMLREKWEAEQREMLENQDTVHYSNVQFDEQRTHGVGFYQFSKDEISRQEEIKKLKKLREETQSQREAKQKLADKRKAMLATRLEKVKQRRLAQGKPVPPPKVEKEEVIEDVATDPIQKETFADPLLPVKEPSIREWDLGKPELLIPKKPAKPSGWVNPRDIRDEEFAPPSFYYPKEPAPCRDSKQHQATSTDTMIHVPYNESTSTNLPVVTKTLDRPSLLADIPLPDVPSKSDQSKKTPTVNNICFMIKSLRDQS